MLIIFPLGIAIIAFLGARLAREEKALASLLVVAGVLAVAFTGYVLLLSMCGLGGGACP
jgi:hypothetical protein